MPALEDANQAASFQAGCMTANAIPIAIVVIEHVAKMPHSICHGLEMRNYSDKDQIFFPAVFEY